MSTLGTLALSFALIAFAGTETTGTETDTGTDTGTETDDGCGECSQVMPPVILAPADGAMLESPFSVEVEPGNECWCDDCGCTDVEHNYVRIYANGELAGAGSIELLPFEIELAPGTYELTALAESEWGQGESEPISITVVGDGMGESGDGESGGNLTAAGEDDVTGDSGAPADSDAGCACSATDDRPLLGGLSLVGLLGLIGMRRRSDITPSE